MAISRISAHSAQAASVSITTPTIGDLILVFAHRDGSTTAPSLPAGFTNIASGGANTNSARIGYKISTGTETSTGTWTNATSVCAGIYRGCDPNTPIGGWTAQGGTVANGANMTYPALTMFRTDNSSWAVGLGAGRAVTDCGTNAPSGMGTRSSATDVAIFDTNATVTSWSAQTATVTATATQGYRTYTVELLAKRTNTFSPDPLIQAVSTLAQDEAGNAFQCLFPNTTLANNCLVIAFAHTHGVSVSSVTDNNSVAWTAGPTAVGDGVSTQKDARLYYTLGAAATTKVTVTFSGNVQNFDFVLAEFKGVKTSAAVDGTATGSNAQVTPFLQAGSITTTQAGDLVLNYGHDAYTDAWTGSPATITGISEDSGFSLLAASRRNLYGLQYGIQAASGAINPTLVMKAKDSAGVDITDLACLALSIAFKMDGSGTSRPAGIRIVRVHTDTGFTSVAGTQVFQFPCSGNLLVGVTSSWSTLGLDWSATVDVNANTWTDATIQSDCPNMWYAANAVTDPHTNISCTWTGAGGVRDWVRLYDVIGAATAPFDTSAFASGSQSNAGDDIVNAPQITPTTSNGLVIAMGGTVTGPSDGMLNPSGAIYDNHIYTGETDNGWMNNGDENGHVYNTGTSQLSFGWSMNNPSATQWNISAMAFKAPSVAASPKSLLKNQAVNRAAFY